MRHFILIAALAGGLAVLPAPAASVRNLAFDLPAIVVSFDLSPADTPAGSPTLWHIEARRNQFSRPLTLPSGNYVASSSAFKATTQFSLPDTAGARFLLLILPKPDGTCHIMPIADSNARIGPGDRFLLNATGDEIAVRFGTERSTLKPGSTVVFRLPHSASKDRRIEVEMARKVGTAWLAFNSTYWPLDPLARSFVLIHPDPVTGTPRVRNLAEVP
jgi:hypothetical protein